MVLKSAGTLGMFWRHFAIIVFNRMKKTNQPATWWNSDTEWRGQFSFTKARGWHSYCRYFWLEPRGRTLIRLVELRRNWRGRHDLEMWWTSPWQNKTCSFYSLLNLISFHLFLQLLISSNLYHFRGLCSFYTCEGTPSHRAHYEHKANNVASSLMQWQ